MRILINKIQHGIDLQIMDTLTSRETKSMMCLPINKLNRISRHIELKGLYTRNVESPFYQMFSSILAHTNFRYIFIIIKQPFKFLAEVLSMELLL